MGLYNITTLLNDAFEKNYALGAYNIYALCQADALIKIHEENGSPLIIQVADPANGFLGGNADFMNATVEDKFEGAKRIANYVKKIADKSDTPICLHLDHGKSYEAIVNAIDAGFSSVMYDGSHLSLEENIKNTKRVVEYAHAKGVSVEAELGVLCGVEDDVISDESRYTNPEQALYFIKETGVDCLAISYGTSHGANKGKDAKLKGKIVQEIKKKLKEQNISCPLVSHGSSNVPQDIVVNINELGGNIKGANGISFEELSKVIPNGICKINVDTDIRLATTMHFRRYFSDTSNEMTKGLEEIKSFLDTNPSCFDPRVFMVAVMDKIITEGHDDHELDIIKDLMAKGVYEICSRTIPVFGSKNMAKSGMES
jgi:fructose-bisphosphate aldolase class II